MKMDSLLDYDFSKKILKSSKLETNVYIYNGENCNLNFDNINEDNFMEIFKNYLFRLVIGANDHSSRNFITDRNNIYSIDDHCLDVDFKDLNLKMKKENKIKWNMYIKKYKTNILSLLNLWLHKFKYQNMINRINKLINHFNESIIGQ